MKILMCCYLNIPSVLENNGVKVMKELQVEDEEEERFQADLKMAVRQSLGIISVLTYIYRLVVVILKCIFFYQSISSSQPKLRSNNNCTCSPT